MTDVFYIVNEDGNNVRVEAGIGDDGNVYKRIAPNHIVRLVYDPLEDANMIDGDFDEHSEPFFLK